MATWHFRKHLPAEPVRNPIQGEFFSTEAIPNAAEALVREGIQNSLDAKDGGQVRVRIYLSGTEAALKAQDILEFTEGLQQHLDAPENGLQMAPNPTEACEFLVFEDFGTTGLNGSPAQLYADDAAKNGFYMFFRAEGLSEKDTKDRGRWGVGKTVFPRASRAGAFFGLTVQSDGNRRLLMGRGTMKFHKTADGCHFTSDGYFGEREGEDDLTRPVADAEATRRFGERFRLTRINEPGLSVVVPWCEPDVTFDKLKTAAIRGYFFPILSGELTVALESPERTDVLTGPDIVEAAEAIGGSTGKDLAASIELAKWGLGLTPSDFVALPPPPGTGAMKWEKERVTEAVCAAIRERLASGDALALRVPVIVRPKGQAPQSSHFDIFMKRDDGAEEGRPIFVRGGIIVSDVRSPRNRHLRSLVVIRDGPLATLLGDAETPAHTQWQSVSHFKDKYTHGPTCLDFVRDSVSRLIRLATEDDQKRDFLLAKEFFSVPDEAEPPSSDDEPDDTSNDKMPKSTLPVSKPRPIRIDLIAGGFGLRPGSVLVEPGKRFRVQLAYDVRRGNALKRYSKQDFEVFKGSVRLTEPAVGLDVSDVAGNEFCITVTSPAFALKVIGFDEARDLVVRVTEPRDAAEA